MTNLEQRNYEMTQHYANGHIAKNELCMGLEIEQLKSDETVCDEQKSDLIEHLNNFYLLIHVAFEQINELNYENHLKNQITDLTEKKPIEEGYREGKHQATNKEKAWLNHRIQVLLQVEIFEKSPKFYLEVNLFNDMLILYC